MIKFIFENNKKFLEQITNKNVYCPITTGIITVKNNENFYEEYKNSILKMLIYDRKDLYCYIECDTQEEYDELQTKYVIFKLKE